MRIKTTDVADILQKIPAIHALAADADHIDIKSVSSELSMRQLLANMFSYMPKWVRFLYAVRWLFVRILGMKQTGLPQQKRIIAEEISFEKGANTAFFQVVEAREDQHWFAAATEKHLTAHLGLIAEPPAEVGSKHNKRFHMVTLVHYHHWTGPLYFNLIRPFHHLVVNQMMKAAVQGG